MGFIRVLPSTDRGFESILTIVDHYSKRPHSYLAERLLLRLEWQNYSINISFDIMEYQIQLSGTEVHCLPQSYGRKIWGS